jgi:hypothetical protein
MTVIPTGAQRSGEIPAFWLATTFSPLFLPAPHPLSKTPPVHSSTNTQFCRDSAHTAPLPLASLQSPLCAIRKTPPQTRSSDPLFPLPQNLPPRFGNRVPISTPVSMRFCRIFPLFHPQRLLLLAIYPLSWFFLRSILASSSTHSARIFACPRITHASRDIHNPIPLAQNRATP